MQDGDALGRRTEMHQSWSGHALGDRTEML